MSNIVEMQFFHKDPIKSSDSEEYHEISHDALHEAIFSPKPSKKLVNEYDFFTQHDTGTLRKQSMKKKKAKRKENKVKSGLDIIKSELVDEQLVVKNNINYMHNELTPSFLDKTSKTNQVLKFSGSGKFDAENGYNRRRMDYIHPVFPRILENTINQEIDIDVQYVEPSLFSDAVTEYLESETKQTPKFLDLVINDMQFNYHHTFSLEKLCSTNMIQYNEKYKSVTTLLQDIDKKIDINRRTRRNLKEKLSQLGPHNREDIRFDKNILKYTKNMVELKDKYYQTLKEQRHIVHHILSLWSDIEIIREKSGVTKTDCLLEVNNIEIEQSEYEKNWNEVFEIEYSDMIVKIEYDYLNEYIEYKEYKQFHKNNTSEKNKIVKPKLEIDYNKLKTKVESIVDSIVLRNTIDIILKRDPNILNNLRDKRKTSIANYYFFKVYVDDVFVCESEHYILKEDQSNIEFTEYLSIEILPHNNFINIVLFENDEEMSSYKVQLTNIKKNYNNSNFKYTFTLNKVMEPTCKSIGSGYDIKEIAKNNKVRLKSSNIFKGKLWTTCESNIQINWNARFSNTEMESMKTYMGIERQIKQMLLGKRNLSLNEVTEIIRNLYDNNVEENENIMDALKGICKTEFKISNNFEFEVDENNCELTRIKLLHLRNCGGLLDIENKTVPLFKSQMSADLLDFLDLQKKDKKVLSNFVKETETNAIDVQRFIGIKFVEKLNENLMRKINYLLLKPTYKDIVIDFEGLSIRSYLSNQTNLSLHASNNFTKQGIIKDELLKEQEIHVTIFRAYNLADRSASMREEENEINDIAGYNLHPLRPFVQVSYRGVYGSTSPAVGRHPTWNHTLKIKTRLQPFSSIHINIYDRCKEIINDEYTDEQSYQGSIVYRKFNKWLGAITIPIQSVLTLGHVQGTFKLNAPPLLIGYESSPKNQKESTYYELNQLMRKETLLSLQITTTMSHLAGFHNYRQPVAHTPEDDFIIRHLNEYITEYNNVFPTRNISLTFIDSSGRNKCVSEFLQVIKMPNYECFPKDPKRTESALSKSSGYSKSTSSKSSRKRDLKEDIKEDRLTDLKKLGVFQSDNDAKKSSDNSTGTPKSSRKKELKEEIEDEIWKKGGSDFDKHINAAVRYVSLIPTYEMKDSHAVTLNGMELLKVLYGSPLDHTILLACYFMYLHIKCWVIIGYALPRGLSSYVLIQHYHSRVLRADENVKAGGLCGGNEGFVWYIYDAVSGERFDTRQNGCPLKTVCYVFNTENIWVNIQASQDCESVSFDFSKSSAWQTVFKKPLFITRSITDNLYSKPVDVEDLRVNLETKIKNKIQKWRSRVKTVWNRYCSGLLRDTLAHWEYWSFNPTQPRPNAGHRFKQLMATYKVYGFPLNMSYLNSKLIISSIKSTAIHANDNPNVEFGLGVEIFAYPNNVLSVWIFLASITRI